MRRLGKRPNKISCDTHIPLVMNGISDMNFQLLGYNLIINGYRCIAVYYQPKFKFKKRVGWGT